MTSRIFTVLFSLTLICSIADTADAKEGLNEIGVPQISMERIQALVIATEIQLSKVGAKVQRLEDQLSALYEQREVLEGEPKKLQIINQQIDRLNLTLIEIEYQSDQTTKTIEKLRKTIKK